MCGPTIVLKMTPAWHNSGTLFRDVAVAQLIAQKTTVPFCGLLYLITVSPGLPGPKKLRGQMATLRISLLSVSSIPL